ncbi:TonB-dependent receptor [Sphingomonas alba]|uniref:TonB-dependent receptor n=1 Tax=Sphingomonas alba TaxID=2908208 RepID=A0ABT0RI35_9SPHN|nr:TonB-dependent receptor [Sphingomonas alba]
MKKLILLCTTAAVLPTAAFAQSSSSQDFDKKSEAIVVTATRQQQVGGVVTPDSTKAKAVLTQEYIARQNPGQTILDTINAVPGVSFQNNDAYGSSGGTLTIRGFDSSRISLTFDGIQLNDSGNYAIFSNQQIDPELIEQVNVNLGTTDVDSPTASAVGGTVNLRTRNPYKTFGGRVVGSLGEDDFRRIFAVIDTGEVGPWGTRAYFSASTAKNDNPFNNYGVVDKQQYNAKIYQPIGSNGDYISVAGHYNQNRNNFFGSLPLRTDKTKVVNLGTSAVPIWTTVPRIVGPNAGNRYPDSRDDRFYNINYPCTVDTPSNAAGTAGQDSPSSSTGPDAPGADPNDDYAACGTEFDRRYNPSNTGNIRIQSRWTLTDDLTLTVDPSYQYVKANGGGTVIAREYGFDINPNPAGNRADCRTAAPGPNVVCVPGYFGGNPYFGGVDLNGDGDIKDQVLLLAPSQTQTDRFGVISGLRYVINDNHQVRLTYTFDDAHHRQSGEVGLLKNNGEPFDVFPVNDPLTIQFNGANETLQKRDRRSKAILNQVSAEYRGEFFDDRLTVNLGLRAPFFKRDLTNYCFTSSASGFVECTGQNADLNAIAAANNPYTFNETTGAVTGWAPPGHRVLKYHDILPNLGFIFDVTPQVSVFANYGKGLSVPSTDNLYNAFFFPEGTEQAKPDPETTDSFDGGVRYRTTTIQAQLGLWKTIFHDRSASAFDPELNQTVFRNLGTVDKWGVDASVAWSPLKQLTLYAFGSWMDSKIKDNIQIGTIPISATNPAGTTCDNIDLSAPGNALQAIRSCAFTAGNRESGAPKYSYGFSASGSIGILDLGITAKRTGPRYIFDDNRAVFAGDLAVTTPTAGRLEQFQVYDATAPAYWLFNLDARLNLKFTGLKETYFQLNVYNLFDKFYVGGFGGGLSQALSSRTCNATSFPACGTSTTVQTWGNPPFVQIGAPRTVSGSLSISF